MPTVVFKETYPVKFPHWVKYRRWLIEAERHLSSKLTLARFISEAAYGQIWTTNDKFLICYQVKKHSKLIWNEVHRPALVYCNRLQHRDPLPDELLESPDTNLQALLWESALKLRLPRSGCFFMS